MLLAQRLCPCCSAWKLLSHKVTWPAPWLTSAEPTKINPLHGNYHLMTHHLHLLVYFIIRLALAGMLFAFHCCTPSIHQNAWHIVKVQSMFVEWMKNWCHITSFGSSRKLLSLSVLCEVLPDGHILNGIVFGFSPGCLCIQTQYWGWNNEIWLSLEWTVAQMVKRLPTMWETEVRSLGREVPLEKEMATYSSIPAWKIPRMEESGRLQSMRSQRVGHDWAPSLHLTSLQWHYKLFSSNIAFLNEGFQGCLCLKGFQYHIGSAWRKTSNGYK